jgi:hypothetical protein
VGEPALTPSASGAAHPLSTATSSRSTSPWGSWSPPKSRLFLLADLATA